jgi:hypothetical protein
MVFNLQSGYIKQIVYIKLRVIKDIGNVVKTVMNILLSTLIFDEFILKKYVINLRVSFYSTDV